MQQLSQNLSANLAALDRMFGPSADYYAKEITIYHCHAVILLFDGMASLDSLWTLLLDAASRQAPPVQPGQYCTGMQAYELILHDSAFPPWCFRPSSAKTLNVWMIMHLLQCFPLFCAS